LRRRSSSNFEASGLRMSATIVLEFNKLTTISDIAVFFIAVTAFMLQHLDEIKTYYPFNLSPLSLEYRY